MAKKKKLKEEKVREEVGVILQRSQSSCMIKRDAKGVASYEVKVYADTEKEAVSKAITQFLCLDGEFKR